MAFFCARLTPTRPATMSEEALIGVGVRPMAPTPLQEKSANVAAMASITERAEHEPKSVSSSSDGLARKRKAAARNARQTRADGSPAPIIMRGKRVASWPMFQADATAMRSDAATQALRRCWSTTARCRPGRVAYRTVILERRKVSVAHTTGAASQLRTTPPAKPPSRVPSAMNRYPRKAPMKA